MTASFPSPENPLIVPPGVLDRIRASTDVKSAGYRRAVENGSIVAAVPLAELPSTLVRRPSTAAVYIRSWLGRGIS